MRIYYLVFLFLYSPQLAAQNLVNNPSFEILTGCPYQQISSTISLATGWFTTQNDNSDTPDIFTPCATSPLLNMPDNVGGYQMPFQGITYAGLISYLHYVQNPNYHDFREYMCAELECTLKQGHKYYVGYYLNTAQDLKYTINKMGMKFTPTPQTTNFELNAQIEFVSTSVTFNDTVNWVLLGDTLIADGTERFISIGNFNHDSELTVELLSSNPIDEKAYYYIDNVFVIPLDPNDEKPELDILGEDKMICPQDSYAYDLSQSVTNAVWQDSVSSTSYIVSDTGTYTVTAYVDGCKYQDTVHFTFKEETNLSCETIVQFPNIFTPNNDNENDLFTPLKVVLAANAKLIIVNRWGSKVYESDNIFDGWDGIINGESAPEGVYFWRVDTNDKYEAKPFQFSGSFSLFR